MATSGRRSPDTDEIQCKRCKNKIVTYVKYLFCDSCYHISCAKHSKFQFIDKNSVKCCEVGQVNNVVDDEADNKFFGAMESLATLTDNKIDISIFKYILKQKNLIITARIIAREDSIFK